MRCSADGERGQKAGKRSLSLSPRFGVRLRSGSRKRRLSSSAKKRRRNDVIDLCDSEDEEVEADLQAASVQVGGGGVRAGVVVVMAGQWSVSTGSAMA